MDKQQYSDEPDFSISPHSLVDLYGKTRLLLCNECGWWEIDGDIRMPDGGWMSDDEIPYPCEMQCGGMIDIVDEDSILKVVGMMTEKGVVMFEKENEK